MNTRKLSVAMAAMILGMQLGSPAVASISERDIAMVEMAILEGDVAGLLAVLMANPELMEVGGVLGDALRAFSRNPTQATLAVVARVSNGAVAVALKAAIVNPYQQPTPVPIY